MSSWVITTNCRLHSYISQILLLYKTWWYYNKFDKTRSLGVCYWLVIITQCGHMEHGLKHITFYVQKHIAALVMCYNAVLVRDKPIGAPAFVKKSFSGYQWFRKNVLWIRWRCSNCPARYLRGLTHFALDKMAAIPQTIFSDAFSWMKSFVFWLKFHWSLSLRVQLAISKHWFG